MRTERVRFHGALGNELAGRLELPDDVPVAYGLFAHCFTCSKDLKSAVWISRTLAQHGIAMLRLDFTGIGQSGGNFAETNFSSNVGDLLAAADYLRERAEGPKLLMGHSLGGAVVLVATAKIPESRCVCVLGTPSETHQFADALHERAPEIDEKDEVELVIGLGRFRIRKQLLDDLHSHDLARAIANLNRALLILHSSADRMVDIEHAHRIFSLAAHPKSFISLDRADHLLLARGYAQWVGDLVWTWSKHYLVDSQV